MSVPQRLGTTSACGPAPATLATLPPSLRGEVLAAVEPGAELTRVAVSTAAAVVMANRVAEATLLVPLVKSGERAIEAQAAERRERHRAAGSGRPSGYSEEAA